MTERADENPYDGDTPAPTHPSVPPARGVSVTIADATERLAAFERVTADGPEAQGLRRAAVCVAITGDSTIGIGILLTFRSPRLRGNPAQYALPGGRLDPGETPEQAALRELHEELGLLLPPSAVLGVLDDFVARSGHIITPVVAWAGAAGPVRPNPDEVALVYDVGLAEVDVECQTVPSEVGPIFQWPFRGTVVHAPTAAMVHQFREVVLHGRTTRVGHLGQPRFTWT
ncbi:NUDIX hydrolase [Tsukamurella soli]|uniref:CoA pyrophosphatase n=1 Tax=Tsukamurella soli TaxID=644556 RepID=A0ABP8JCH2_9ACTN